jgi:manganese transport system permease protein
MLVTPGATAFLLTDRFARMNLLAVASAMLATALGILGSYWLDASTAGCIVLVQTALFVAALLLAPRHGLLARRRLRAQPGPPPP